MPAIPIIIALLGTGFVLGGSTTYVLSDATQKLAMAGLIAGGVYLAVKK